MMFGYYVELALRNLKRSPGIAALMVLAIAFGVAASMVTYSVFRAVSGDPIPGKSSKLFVPQIDMWGPGQRDPSHAGQPPDQLDYADAVALMGDHRAKLQSAMYMVTPTVIPSQLGEHPIHVSGFAVYSEFFPMVDAPFKYGSGWSAGDGVNRAQVVVINSSLNNKVFGGVDSIGKMLNINGRDYRVVGVLDSWHPQPRFYDVVDNGAFSINQEDVFIPFQTAVDAGIPSVSNSACGVTEPSEPGFAGLQRSSCVWISYMVELDDPAAVRKYEAYLAGFAARRFSWPANVRLRNLMEWFKQEHVVPGDTNVSLLVALGLLIVSLVNMSGLLLAKFMRRSSEIGVRRAVGATRGAIYAQFLTEAGIVGLAGGVVGLLLTAVGIMGARAILPKDIAALAHVDVQLLLATFALAIIASLLAGAYPTWRASRVQPAWQIRVN